MDSRLVVARFEAERQVLALMDHSNLARVLDAGSTPDGRPFFVMDLVKGVPISHFCDSHKLTLRQRLELFVPVCQAVQHAHQKGVIHRDLKPSNVLVALYDGRPVPKVIDFGVAKAAGQSLTDKTLVTGFGAIVGTLEYMSPEQAELNNLDIDTRSDVYSLGVLLYELLTGTTPFGRKELEQGGMLEMLRVIREQEPTRPSTKLSTAEGLPTLAANRGTEPAKLAALLRGELDWIVMKALEKDRSRRYESANGFALDVQRYLTDEPVLACPPSLVYRLGKFARRNKTGLAMAGMALVFLVVLASIAGWVLRDREAREQEIAQEADRKLALNQQAIRQDLDEADEYQLQKDWWRALELTERAWGLFQTGGGLDGLQDDLRQRLAYLRMAILLHEIPLSQAGLNERGKYDLARADEPYTRAFRDYGINVDELSAEEAARRIRASPIRQELVGALDNWANARRTLRGPMGRDWQKLAQIARLAYPDRWANEIRDAMKQGAAEGLVKLARMTRVENTPVESLVALARALRRRGLNAEAVALLEEAQLRYPRDFWVNQELAWALERLNPPRLEEAISYHRVACVLHPRSPGAYLNLGLAQARKHNFKGAINSYQRALHIAPNYAQAHSNLGSVLRAIHDLPGAIRHFRRALELMGTRSRDAVVVHCNLGHALVATNPDEAERHYRRALKIDPEDAYAHADLGHVLSAKKDLDGAIRHYRISLKFDPNYDKAHYNLGNALVDKKDRQGAIQHYRMAVEINPKYAKAHYCLGNLLNEKKDVEGAIRHFRRALEIDPELAEAHCNLGHTLCDQGKFALALEELKRGHELGSRQGAKWRYPSGQWVKFCERLLELDGRLPRALEGETASPSELLALAELCLRYKNRNRDAAWLFGKAFAAEPKWAEDLNKPYGYNAVRAAVLAAQGKGVGAEKLDDKDRARLRKQALGWLQGLRTRLAKLLARQPTARRPIQMVLRHWLGNPDLKGVRDAKELEALPHDEREAWQKLWSEVRELMARAGDK
jgi:tetratricopeptide (TPR) repeat protein